LRLTNHGRMVAFAADFADATRAGFDRVVGFHPMPGLDVLFLADHVRNRSDTPRLKRLLPRFHNYARLEASCFGKDSRTRILGLARAQIDAFIGSYPHAASRITMLPPTISDARRKPQLRTAERRSEVRARLGIGQTSPAWLWLGTQPHVKGLDRAVAALALNREATLMVGGLPGDDRKVADIIRDARKLCVEDRIRWLGYLVSEEVLDHFAAADALAHPARVDVTGATILEAVVNGLPVVLTDACGFAQHVEKSGAGLVVSADFQLHAFVAALDRVCGPENAAFSRNGVAYGQSPHLYRGLSIACDLIEAEVLPDPPATGADGALADADGVLAEPPTWSP
jgi:UDP-glucose:(heptosyl)LPS alpha-1,3-glucosyltransferase